MGGSLPGRLGGFRLAGCDGQRDGLLRTDTARDAPEAVG
jgi:hypothetical protein